MKRARADHGLTQDELATAVGKRIKGEAPSQALMSKIESGATESSEYVIPICEVLSIPLPEHFLNEDDRDWSRLGRVLRSKDVEQYRRWVSLLESIAGPDKDEPEPAEPTDPTRPERK